jgi:hypothetical protein
LAQLVDVSKSFSLSIHGYFMRFAISACCCQCLLIVLSIALAPVAQVAHAQDKTVAAQNTAVHGALLMRTKAGGWQSVAANAEIPADRQLVALFGAEFTSDNEAVQLRLVADVGQRGPFPVLEASVRFHANKKVDLDMTLERGVAVLSNKKKAGAAHVRLLVRDEVFEITLSEPRARLGIEIYGRHVPGQVQLSDPKKDDPVANVAFFALEGEVFIGNGKHRTRLQSPPGNALYLWDSLTRQPEVQRFDKLPDFAKPLDEKELKAFGTICGFAKSWIAEPDAIGKTILDQAIGGSEMSQRKAAVVALGALDDLPRLIQVLDNRKSADARDMAVVVMRHWLGREPGQSVLLYEYLTKKENYTPVQAKSLIHLFHGIESEARRKASTYDALLQGLSHSKMTIRVMAHWHLVRLAPDGKTIAYDAAASEQDRDQAIAAWRRLIPEGELPPPPKQKTSIP